MERAPGYILCQAQIARRHMHAKCLRQSSDFRTLWVKSTWTLTGINNNDLAVATRHDFLRRIVNVTL